VDPDDLLLEVWRSLISQPMWAGNPVAAVTTARQVRDALIERDGEIGLLDFSKVEEMLRSALRVTVEDYRMEAVMDAIKASWWPLPMTVRPPEKTCPSTP